MLSGVFLLRDPLRRQFRLGEFGCAPFPDRNVDHRQPDAALAGFAVEVLVLHSVFFYRQQDQVACLPVVAHPIHYGVAFAFDYEDGQTSLVPMPPGVGSDIVEEEEPVLQANILISERIQIPEQSSLAA